VTASLQPVQTLLTASLLAWRIDGTVVLVANGRLRLVAGDTRIDITAAPADLPFRWMMTDQDRTRGCMSVAGLLRAVRQVLDPNYTPVRVRVALLPGIST
jgi:hypothetical protein